MQTSELNQLLAIIGGFNSILLFIIGYFLKETLADLREAKQAHEEKLSEHETRLTVLEKTKQLV